MEKTNLKEVMQIKSYKIYAIASDTDVKAKKCASAEAGNLDKMEVFLHEGSYFK